MSLPRLHGMPEWVQHLIESDNQRPVIVYQKKRFSLNGFIIKLIIGILLLVVGIYLFLRFLPDIIILGGGI